MYSKVDMPLLQKDKLNESFCSGKCRHAMYRYLLRVSKTPNLRKEKGECLITLNGNPYLGLTCQNSLKYLKRRNKLTKYFFFKKKTNLYRIHSNKRPEHLGKSFQVVLIVSIFVARINPKIYDFCHFQANSQSY